MKWECHYVGVPWNDTAIKWECQLMGLPLNGRKIIYKIKAMSYSRGCNLKRIYFLGFLRGLSQYGLLHLGQTLGFSFIFVIHSCSHLSHIHLKTVASSMLIDKRMGTLIYKDYLKYHI